MHKQDLFKQNCIRANSGEYIDFTDLENSIFYIEDIAHSLSRLPRFGGHPNRHYTVAQHSLLVASLVPDAFALYALLHDAQEAYLLDVPTPLKALLPEYKILEEKVASRIGNALSVHQHFDNYLKNNAESKVTDNKPYEVLKKEYSQSRIAEVVNHADAMALKIEWSVLVEGSTHIELPSKSFSDVRNEFIDEYNRLLRLYNEEPLKSNL